MTLAFSSSFSFFEFISRHPGIVFVTIGVIGEVFFDWPDMTGRRKWAKRTSALMLIAGLLMEISEAAKSDVEVAQLTKRAAQFSERAALVESNNLVLRTNVASLEIAVRQLVHVYDQSTNALAEATARLATIKPAKERLIDCLNALNPEIIIALKTNAFVRFSDKARTRVYNEMEGLSEEAGAKEFIRNFIPNTSVMTISTGDPRTSGVFANLNFEVLHSLLE